MDKANDNTKMLLRLAKKITTMESKVDNFTSDEDHQQDRKSHEVIAVNNVVKIEKLESEIEKLKLEVVRLKDENETSSKLDLNSNNTARWYKTKFQSHLEAPESRRYIKDLLDTKLASFQVSFSFINLFRT